MAAVLVHIIADYGMGDPRLRRSRSTDQGPFARYGTSIDTCAGLLHRRSRLLHRTDRHPRVVSGLASSRSLIHADCSPHDFPLTALKFSLDLWYRRLNSSLSRQDLRSLIHLFVINANADHSASAAHAFFIEAAVLCERRRILKRLPQVLFCFP